MHVQLPDTQLTPAFKYPQPLPTEASRSGYIQAKGPVVMTACRTAPPRIAPYLLGHPEAPTTPLLLLVSFKNESLWLSHLDSRGDQREWGGADRGCCGNELQLAKEWGRGPSSS